MSERRLLIEVLEDVAAGRIFIYDALLEIKAVIDASLAAAYQAGVDSINYNKDK